MHLLILAVAALAQYSVEPGYTVDPRFSVTAAPAPKAAPTPKPDNNLLDVHGITIPVPDLPEHGGPSGTVNAQGEKVRFVQEQPKAQLPVFDHGAHFSIRNADGTPYKLGTKPKPAKATPPPAPTAPTLYVMTDATGKQWSSNDPAWLAEWVRRVNTPPAAPMSYLPAAVGGCANGQCGAATFEYRRGFFGGRFGGGFR